MLSFRVLVIVETYCGSRACSGRSWWYIGKKLVADHSWNDLSKKDGLSQYKRWATASSGNIPGDTQSAGFWAVGIWCYWHAGRSSLMLWSWLVTNILKCTWAMESVYAWTADTVETRDIVWWTRCSTWASSKEQIYRYDPIRVVLSLTMR